MLYVLFKKTKKKYVICWHKIEEKSGIPHVPIYGYVACYDAYTYTT